MELGERRLNPTLRRENSGLGKRFETHGPVVLKSARFRVVRAVRGSFRRGTRVRAEPEEQPRFAPVSTAVTRSIGDWDAARTLIPQPDLYRFEVGASEHERVVLASDGVWDFVSAAQAAKAAGYPPEARTQPSWPAPRLVPKFRSAMKMENCVAATLPWDWPMAIA